MSERSYEPYYRIETFRHDDARCEEHLGLAYATYARKGFVREGSLSVRDRFDGPGATYYRLSRAAFPDVTAGIFRMIEGGDGSPALHAHPHHAINGVPDRFCECTRVIAARERDFMGQAVARSQYVLFEAVVQSVAYVRRRGLWGVISLGSPSIFEWINEVFGGVQQGLSPPFWYEGGPVIQSLIWRDEFERRVRTHDPAIHAYYQAACARGA